MEHFKVYIDQLVKLGIAYAPKVLLATIVLFLGWTIVNRVTAWLIKWFDKSDLNSPEVETFLSSIFNIGFKVLLVISIAGILGIETTSFVGIIAAMGFAVGLALQGNLSNFASGVLILMFRPFKVGDEVKIQTFWATVKEIQIFHTVLRLADQSVVIIPNSVVMNGTIQNMSVSAIRGLSIPIRIPFNEDVDRVMKVATDALSQVSTITQAASFSISDFQPHCIQMTVDLKVAKENYWSTNFSARKALIDAFVKHNIKVAYPDGVTYGEFGVSANKIANSKA
jgi:small conductance mechanosensitive channel